MKATGIVRNVDELGRIVLPVEIRKTLDINEKDPVEVFVDGEDIILRKFRTSCIFCGSYNDLQLYTGKKVCRKCIQNLKERV